MTPPYPKAATIVSISIIQNIRKYKIKSLDALHAELFSECNHPLLEHFSFYCSHPCAQVSFCFVCPCYILARETGNDGKRIDRTARAALTKRSPVRIWLYYFEKCSNDTTDSMQENESNRTWQLS